jgi:hypothetical protein
LGKRILTLKNPLQTINKARELQEANIADVEIGNVNIAERKATDLLGVFYFIEKAVKLRYTISTKNVVALFCINDGVVLVLLMTF